MSQSLRGGENHVPQRLSPPPLRTDHETTLMGRSANRLAGAAFLGPATLVVLLGVLLPVVLILGYVASPTLSHSAGSNLARIASDPTLPAVLRQTTTFVLASLAGHIILGFALAWALDRNLNRTFLAILRSVFLIPWAISPVVVASIWRLLYQPDLSPLAPLLQLLPFAQRGMLGDPGSALWAVIVVNWWFATPFYMLVLLARFQAIPRPVYEASAIDGAGPIAQIRYITIPEVRNLLVALAVFDLIAALNTFDIVWILTQGGPMGSTELLATYMYKTAFQRIDFGYASALGLVLLGFMVIGAGGLWMLRAKD